MILPGVLLEISGIGVLMTGRPGVGKSELALELISRGCCLVADDVVECSSVGSNRVIGVCPPILRDFLEVRGLGILNIRAMFGDGRVKPQAELEMILSLEVVDERQIAVIRCLEPIQATRDVLGVSIPLITIPVVPGRNLAVLVEAAARNYLLKRHGYNAAQSFIDRQRSLLN